MRTQAVSLARLALVAFQMVYLGYECARRSWALGLLTGCNPKDGGRADKLSYTGSIAMDFSRLLSRICSAVNSPPQTLQRQPRDAACITSGFGC